MPSITKAELEKRNRDWKMAVDAPNIHKGLNVTFRNFDDKYEGMLPGDTLLLLDRGGSVVGNARIVDATVFNHNKWAEQIEYLLTFEQDPNVRTYEEWIEKMNSVYEKKNWGPRVVAVLFWVK